MGIHVGSQNAQTINNVEGTQYNSHGAFGGDPRQLVEELRAQLERVTLPAHLKAAASTEVEKAEAALSRREPDKRAVAECLSRLAATLSSAGALLAAGTGLGGPLVALARWLGALGEPIARLLHR